MSDRELLELAAKAAGYGEVWTLDNYPNTFYIGPRYTGGAPKYRAWNPLTDDGDALRLAVKLGLTVTPNYHVEQRSLGVIVFTELADSEDSCTATRRAIVRAAAEIGRNIK
jgi:hypothetical protein